MFVFIAHAEADQAAANDLKAFLKSRGLVVETETGARGFRHLQASDVVIALWSQKSVFATHRMQIERRMFEAWESGRLVLVKLDHGFLPVGLRDLPAIDASFESNRQLAVWPQVERAAKEAMNRALVEKEKREGEFGRPPSRDAEGTKGSSKEGSRRKDTTASVFGARDGHSDARSQSQLSGPAAMSMRRFAIALAVVVLAAFFGVWALSEASQSGANIFVVTAGLVSVVLFAVGLSIFVGSESVPSKKAAERAAASGPEQAAAEPAPTAVFISYAHADDAAVRPVVKVVEDNGRQVWIDKTGVHTGDGWAGEIVRAIKGAKGMMVMCSKQAFESDHIKREVYLADKYKKPMAPVFLEAAQPPEDFEYFFAGVQWLELYKLAEEERPAAIGRALASV